LSASGLIPISEWHFRTWLLFYHSHRGIDPTRSWNNADFNISPGRHGFGLAGRFAFALFVWGIVGTGLLAVPVLAASAAYGIGEACRWQVSLERTPKQAVRFYAVICAATLVGLSLNFLHIDPVKALFGAAVVNGLVAAPLMAIIIVMASTTPRPKAGEIFSRVHPKLALYSHIGRRDVDAAKLVELTRRTYSGPLEVGDDLMTIEVGDKIEIRRAAE